MILWFLEAVVLRLSQVEKLTGRKEKGWAQTSQNNTPALQICFISCSWMLLGSAGLLEGWMLLKVMWRNLKLGLWFLHEHHNIMVFTWWVKFWYLFNYYFLRDFLKCFEDCYPCTQMISLLLYRCPVKWLILSHFPGDSLVWQVCSL